MTLVRNLKWMMVVLALVAAACGSGDDGSGTAATVQETPEQADDGGGAVVSADGALTVIAPAGSGVVTVVEAEGIEELDSVGSSLRAYELGPDGSTFDEPVELRFEATLDELAGGVLVAARSSDGTVEPLEATIEISGESAVIVATIRHFTRVELRYGFYADVTVKTPGQVTKGAPVEVELQTTSKSLEEGEVLTVKEGTGGEWSATGGVSGAGPDSFVCESVGQGSVSYSGLIIFRFVFFDEDFDGDITEDWTVQGPVKNASGNVECVEAGTVVPPEDTECTDLNAQDTTGCVNVSEFVVSGGNSPTVRLSTDPALTGAPDEKVTIALLAEDSDGQPVMIQCSETDGCFGYFGQGFSTFVGDFTIEPTIEDGIFVFNDIPVRDEGSVLVLDVPPGELIVGVGDVPGGPRTLTEVRVRVRQGELESTTVMDFDAFSAVFLPR
jgi:hypothetical protein